MVRNTEDRNKLYHITHSADPHPNHGPNPHAGRAGEYDPKVTDLLEDIALRNDLPTTSVNIIKLVQEVNDLSTRVEKAVDLLKSGTAPKVLKITL
jgi:hypothetical protein